jgi:hypothetical protein
MYVFVAKVEHGDQCQTAAALGDKRGKAGPCYTEGGDWPQPEDQHQPQRSIKHYGGAGNN